MQFRIFSRPKLYYQIQIVRKKLSVEIILQSENCESVKWSKNLKKDVLEIALEQGSECVIP